jgi:excinuclease UvrABC nuclease subunit
MQFLTRMQYKADIIIQNTHEALLGVASTTGVYVYKQTGTPIYIGKAVNQQTQTAPPCSYTLKLKESRMCV